jgi:hypothetical protein
MRDEYDARFWIDHHEGFADGVDRVLARLQLVLGRLPAWDGSSQHLIALVAAFAITLLTFGRTVA